MTRTWTTTGGGYTEGSLDFWAGCFDRLEWVDVGGQRQEGAIPALNIRHVHRELRLPRLSHYAISSEAAPYGLYGLRLHYSNGIAQLYVLDLGAELIPLASDFWSDPEPATAAMLARPGVFGGQTLKFPRSQHRAQPTLRRAA